MDIFTLAIKLLNLDVFAKKKGGEIYKFYVAISFILPQIIYDFVSFKVLLKFMRTKNILDHRTVMLLLQNIAIQAFWQRKGAWSLGN